MQTKFQEGLHNHIQAGYQIMSVVTADWMRIEQELHEYTASNNFGLLTWNCAEGLRVSRWPGPRGEHPAPTPPRWLEFQKALTAVRDKLQNPQEFLNFLMTTPNWLPGKGQTNAPHDAFVIAALDIDSYFKAAPPLGPGIVTRMSLLAARNTLVNDERMTPLVTITTNMDHVDKSKPWITPLNYPYPDQEWFQKHITEIATENSVPVDPDPDTIPRIAKGLLGLNERDGSDTLMLAIREHRGITKNMMRSIYAEKAKSLQRSGVLTFIPFEDLPSHEHLRGFDNYIEFIQRRSAAYSDEAQKLGIDLPKGVVLIGVPGTGKSQVAFATASVLGLPCVLLDVGAIFDKFVGSSEARVTEALKQIEALSGCVLVIDEADKGFRGMADGGGDSGVSSRVFGKILSWLANKKDRTFVIMTMNTTEGLPPELLRPGRFDAMFSTEMPSANERHAILETHLRKRGVDPAPLQADTAGWNTLIEITKDFTGAELELGVQEARYTAFERRKNGTPTVEELRAALTDINPVSKLDDTKIEQIRKFCATRTRRVSKDVEARELGGDNATTVRKTRHVNTQAN